MEIIGMKIKATTPLIRNLSILTFFFMAMPGLLFWLYFFNSGFFINEESHWLIYYVTPIIAGFEGLKGEAAATFSVIVPALLSAIAITPQQDKLSWPQVISLFVLTISVITNITVVIFFGQHEPVYFGEALIKGEVIGPKLVVGADLMFKSSIAYFLFIVGLQSQVEKSHVQ
jgi:hypothetical protein